MRTLLQDHPEWIVVLAGGAATGIGALLSGCTVEGVGFLLVCMPAPALIRHLAVLAKA